MTQETVDLFGMSELELAGIDEETFDKLIKVELSQKGILCPVPVDDIDLELPEPTREIWGVKVETTEYGHSECNFYFDSYEKAKAFIELNPFPTFNDYKLPMKILQENRVKKYLIYQFKIYDSDFVKENYPELREAGTYETHNRKVRSETYREERVFDEAVRPYNDLKEARLEAISRGEQMGKLYDIYMDALETTIDDEKERHNKCLEVLEKKFDRKEIDFWLSIEG